MSEGTTDQQANAGMAKQLSRWLFQQEAAVVIQFLILMAIGYFSYQAATTYIPRHLDAIKEGYQEISDDNNAAQERQSKQFADALKSQTDACETRMKSLLEAQDRERGLWRELVRPRLTVDGSTTAYPGAP